MPDAKSVRLTRVGSSSDTNVPVTSRAAENLQINLVDGAVLGRAADVVVGVLVGKVTPSNVDARSGGGGLGGDGERETSLVEQVHLELVVDHSGAGIAVKQLTGSGSQFDNGGSAVRTSDVGASIANCMKILVTLAS